MTKAVLLIALLCFRAFGQPPPSPAAVEGEAKGKAVAREAELARAVEKQEIRHYDLHRTFIPMTQSNLQWLAGLIGARPDEALIVWKLMRGWDASRAARFAAENPS